jgi:CheY-like chemotaxis protein
MSRVLVVDDDPDLRALVGAYLKAAGHVVEFAVDGVEGVEAAARRLPELIVTDFQMPRMDGFGLFNAVRANPRAANVPVVMLTAHNSREMMNKALSLGVDDFLGKPITRDELVRVVAERLHPSAPVKPAAPGAAGKAEFFGSVLCCGLCSLERFALALVKEELDELLAKFAADASIPVQRDGGWLVQPDFHHLFGAFEEGPEDVTRHHALRALRAALGVVLAAQRLKPWIASRFAGRDLPEFVVALGVHTGRIQMAPPGATGMPSLRGEAAEIAAFLAESALGLHWSVAASRALAKSAGFAFLAGRGAQLRMPKSQGTVKVVEVKGLERPAGPAPQPSRVATLIEAAVDRNATLVTYAPKKAAPAAAPAPAAEPPARPAPAAPPVSAPTPAPAPAPAPAPTAKAPAPAKAPPPSRPTAPAKAPAPDKAPAPTKTPAPAKVPTAPPAPAVPQLKPGELVPGYTAVRKLADNGTVAVHLVNPSAGGPQVVVKTIQLSADKKKRPHVQKFIDHYAAIDAIEHPHIARTFGQGLTETFMYVVQEYCAGGDLRNLVADRMTAEDAVKTVLRLAGALRAAHQKGFVHGDLKPANVMIRADGSFALVDFALARIVEYVVGEGEAGVILRAPDYLSPEMINGLPADAQSDIYTLGLLLHEMLLGKRAYDWPDVSRVVMDHLNAPVPKLPEGYERFQPLLDKLMAKSRPERFATMQEVIAFMAQAKL